MRFILSININDDDGVPTCEELGKALAALGAVVTKKAADIPRVADCGERGEPRPVKVDGRIVGSWRIE